MKPGIVLVTLLIFVLSGPLRAQDLTPKQEATAHEIFNDIMSPYCPGRALNDCPSSQATDLKTDIRKQISSGQSKDQILDNVFARIGEEYRSVPKPEGFGALAWAMPISFLVIGSIIIFTWLSSKTAPAANTETNTLSPEMQARIDDEIARNTES